MLTDQSEKGGQFIFHIKTKRTRWFIILERDVLIFKNCKGFSLAETMIAFSIWLLIITVFIPHLVLLTQERANNRQSLTAIKLLHEKVQGVSFQNTEKVNETFMKDNVAYHLTWEEDMSDQKACLEWKNHYKKTKSVCLLVS